MSVAAIGCSAQNEANEAEIFRSPVPKPGPLLVGEEPFRDTFDRHRKGLWSISHGWRNGDWTVNDWRRSQAVFEGGDLRMTLARKKTDLADFSGAELQTKRRYGHGYFEVRMQAAKASGSVSSFFTYTGPPFGDPWNEIDVEILGSKPREVLLTYFTDAEKRMHTHKVAFDTTAGMHTYGFDWQPGHLRWYIDGEMVHEASAVELPLPNMKQKLMTSLWASTTLTSWVGPFRPETLPSSMIVECISYSKDYASRKPCD